MEDTEEDLIKCEQCGSTNVTVNHYSSPANSWVGEQDISSYVCRDCGYEVWD
jgi:DNA-directed RNA polymerase subunit RPC12/RpoP